MSIFLSIIQKYHHPIKVYILFKRPEYEKFKNSSTNEHLPEDQHVSIDAIYRVFHHGERQRGDTHRFALTEDPEDFMSLVNFHIRLYIL